MIKQGKGVCIMKEIWRTIEDYPEYEVSTYGRIRSKKRNIVDSWGRQYCVGGNIIKLTTQITKGNYKQVMVSIWSNHKNYRLIVSRLVAKTFIPNPNNFPQVNHKDEDSTNNMIDNLEWCSCRYNVHYKDNIKRRAKSRSKKIDVYDNCGNLIDIVNSGVEASKKYNVNRGQISQCCNEKAKTAKGYVFKFHKE